MSCHVMSCCPYHHHHPQYFEKNGNAAAIWFGSVRFGTVGGEDEMNAARAEHATRYDEAGLQHNTILALVDRRIS